MPGLMGSELWRGSERIFPNIKMLFTNPEVVKYPLPLEARKIVEEVVIIPNGAFFRKSSLVVNGNFLISARVLMSSGFTWSSLNFF